jgi:DNA-binding MarR family transcriptional regulator
MTKSFMALPWFLLVCCFLIVYFPQILIGRENQVFEQKMISSGDNFSSINLNSKHYEAICIALHQGIVLRKLEEQIGIDGRTLQEQIDELWKEGLLVKIDGVGFLPSFPVITKSDAKQHFNLLPEVVNKTVDKIKALLPEVKNKCSSIKSLSELPFESYSLFVLSNVLLDNFQIRNVEKLVLKSERPCRGGKNYYFSIQEKGPTESEAFGIYGNDRNGPNFLNVSVSEITHIFPNLATEANPKESFIHCLEKHKSKDWALEGSQNEWLEKVGIISSGSFSIPILRMQDVQELQNLASIFSGCLADILNDHKLFCKLPI